MQGQEKVDWDVTQSPEEGELLENRQVASAMRTSAALGESQRHTQVAVLSSFLAFVH